MNACKIRLGNLGMALPASGRYVEVVYFGKRILRGPDSVAAVTVRATRCRLVSAHHRSSMDALFVEFHGMREWNLVAREELRVAVAGGASVGQVLFGHRRGYIAQALNLMD